MVPELTLFQKKRDVVNGGSFYWVCCLYFKIQNIQKKYASKVTINIEFMYALRKCWRILNVHTLG